MRNNNRQIVLDTETTGLSPSDGHRIIEVAAIEMVNRRFTGNHLHLYINPERKIDVEAQKVHGLSLDFLKDKPKFNHIADELFAYIEGSELIIHNAPFDLGFLDHEFGLTKKDYPLITDCCTIIDTLLMARNKHRGQKNNLDALCKRYNVDNSNREKHGALIDTQLLAEVYIAMTGGQMTLFDTATEENKENSNTTKTNKHQNNISTRIDSHVFKILRANDAELQAHEEYMEKL